MTYRLPPELLHLLRHTDPDSWPYLRFTHRPATHVGDTLTFLDDGGLFLARVRISSIIQERRDAGNGYDTLPGDYLIIWNPLDVKHTQPKPTNPQA